MENSQLLDARARTWGIIVSLLFHGLMLTGFAFWQIHQKLAIPEFSEMVLPSGPAVTAEGDADNRQAEQEKIRSQLPENIELPEKMELKDDERLSRVEKTRAVEDLKPVTGKREMPETPALKTGNRGLTDMPLKRKLSADYDFTRPSLTRAEAVSGAGQEVEKIYSIEWQGDFKREVLYEVLPNVNNIQAREAEIRLEFTVEPDGTVSLVRPVQKGGMLQLENATVDALKKWRFNPLAGGQAQNSQKGIIIFRFISK